MEQQKCPLRQCALSKFERWPPGGLIVHHYILHQLPISPKNPGRQTRPQPLLIDLTEI